MTIEEIGERHTITAKLKIDAELTPRQRAYYLLFMASEKETKEFLRKEQEK